MASFKTVVRDALFGGLIAGSGVTSTLLASTRSRRNYDDLDAILWELDDGRHHAGGSNGGSEARPAMRPVSGEQARTHVSDEDPAKLRADASSR